MGYLLYHASNDRSVELMSFGQEQLVVYTPPLLEPNAHTASFEKKVREVKPGLAAIIEQGMKQKGYNQSDLTRVSRVSQSTISNILRGVSSFSKRPSYIYKNLSTVLEIDVEELENAFLRGSEPIKRLEEAKAMLKRAWDHRIEGIRSGTVNESVIAKVDETDAYLRGKMADDSFVIVNGRCMPPDRVIAGYFSDVGDSRFYPDLGKMFVEPVAPAEREAAKQLVAEKHGGAVIFHDDIFLRLIKTRTSIPWEL